MIVAGGLAATATLAAALAERRRAATIGSTVAEPRRGSVQAILSTRGVPAGILASIAVLSAADVFTAYMPVLGEQRGIAPGTVGLLLGLRAAASLTSRVGIGAIVRFVGRLRLITISAVASAAAFIGLTVTRDLWILALLTIVAGFGLGFGQPLSMTIVVQRVPEHARGTALALRLTGNRLGQVAVPATAGVLAGSAGVAAVFWLLAAMLVASGIVVQRPTATAQEHVPPPGPAEVETAVE